MQKSVQDPCEAWERYEEEQKNDLSREIMGGFMDLDDGDVWDPGVRDEGEEIIMMDLLEKEKKKGATAGHIEDNLRQSRVRRTIVVARMQKKGKRRRRRT